VIEHLYSSGQLKNQEKGLTLTSYPGNIRENHAQYEAVMHLLERSLSDENKIDLAQIGISNEKLKNLAKTIELQAREQTSWFDVISDDTSLFVILSMPFLQLFDKNYPTITDGIWPAGLIRLLFPLFWTCYMVTFGNYGA
jgi:hypothetical protein